MLHICVCVCVQSCGDFLALSADGRLAHWIDEGGVNSSSNSTGKQVVKSFFGVFFFKKHLYLVGWMYGLVD